MKLPVSNLFDRTNISERLEVARSALIMSCRLRRLFAGSNISQASAPCGIDSLAQSSWVNGIALGVHVNTKEGFLRHMCGCFVRP